MLGHHSECGEERERLERGDGVAVLERIERHVEHRQMVGHEKRIELGAFERLGEALEMVEIEVGVRKRARIAPSPGVDARRAHERAQMQLP